MRTLVGSLLVLLWAATAVAAEPPGADRCTNRPASLVAEQGVATPLASLFTAKPRPQAVITDDCLPPGEYCYFDYFGDCLDCWDDNGQRGVSICSNWHCGPYGWNYTCCSDCNKLNC